MVQPKVKGGLKGTTEGEGARQRQQAYPRVKACTIKAEDRRRMAKLKVRVEGKWHN